MTVESLTNRQAPFACNGVTILFALTLPYFNEEEITVTLKEIATGDETPLTLNVDFEIPGEGDEDYGNIRLIGDYAVTPPSSDYTLYIIRILPLSQLMDLIPGAAFNPINNETAFDRLVMITQQLMDALNRAALAKITSGLSGLTLPVEALKYLRGNAAGDDLEAVEGLPVWHYQAGVPSDATGDDGDYDLNTTNGDIYKKVAGAWGSAIANIMGPKGDPGDDAPTVKYQYSINGSTLWHDTYAGGDKYCRISVDDGDTWSDAMKFIGNDGAGSGDMLKEDYDPDEDGIIAESEIDEALLRNIVEDVTPQLGGDLDLNQKCMVFAVPGTDLIAIGDIETVTVDTNGVGFGAALVQASDGHYDEADADAAATMPCTRLALETGTGLKKVLIRGYIRNDAWNWTTIGAWVFVSTTQGTLSESLPGSGKYSQPVAEIKTADILYFNPSSVQVKAA